MYFFYVLLKTKCAVNLAGGDEEREEGQEEAVVSQRQTEPN